MKVSSIVLLMLFSHFLFGQKEITVRVIDRVTSEPIRNANVVILGTPRGTTTNALGFFKLTLGPDEKMIVVSHVSYVREPIKVPDDIASFTIKMRKASFIIPLDLREYPNEFDSTKLERNLFVPREDSFKIVETLASYPGGMQGFKDYFGNTFNYPESELIKNKEGVIRLEFTIDKSGNYTSVKCFPDSTGALCDEFKRILSVIPKWDPAEQRGEKLDQQMAFPIWYGPNAYWKKKLKEIRTRKIK